MTEEEKRFTKEDAKAMSILDVASSLGMEFRRVGSTAYEWTEHDSFKIDTRKNRWKWYSQEDKGGDTIALVQEIKGVSFKEAMHYLKTGEFPTVSIVEEKREPFRYILAPYEQPFKEARTYLKEERGLSDETIDFFLEQGVLAQAMKKAQDGHLEPVVVFKFLDQSKKVVGASLQGIVPNKERHEGKGYLKQILYNSDGLSGMSVDIGVPKRLIFAEAPIDLMSYYEAHRSVLSDVRLVAMDGLKSGIIARYTMELFAELEGVEDYRFDSRKVDSTLKALQTTSFFKKEENQDFITLAVDNDKAGRNFITKLKEKGVPLTIDIPPILQEGKAKEDWNDYLKTGQDSPDNLYHVYSVNDAEWQYQGYFSDVLAEQKIKELTTDEVVAFRSSRQLTNEEIQKEAQLARTDIENTASQSNVVEEKRDNSRLAQARRKLERLNNEFSEATNAVYSHSSRANGQPMNDKRDGASYFRRQEQLENRVFSTLDEIKKQEERVEHLERQADFKARGLNRQGTGLEMSVDNIPRIKEAIEKFDNGESDFARATIKRYRQELVRLEAMRDRMASTVIRPGAQHLIDKGLVSQWKKRPTLYFVKGLSKVAFELGEDGRFQVSKKYAPQTGAEQEEVERLLSEQSMKMDDAISPVASEQKEAIRGKSQENTTEELVQSNPRTMTYEELEKENEELVERLEHRIQSGELSIHFDTDVYFYDVIGNLGNSHPLQYVNEKRLEVLAPIRPILASIDDETVNLYKNKGTMEQDSLYQALKPHQRTLGVDVSTQFIIELTISAYNTNKQEKHLSNEQFGRYFYKGFLGGLPHSINRMLEYPLIESGNRDFNYGFATVPNALYHYLDEQEGEVVLGRESLQILMTRLEENPIQVIETNKEQSELVQESTKDEVVSERNFEQQEEKQEELTMKQEDMSTIEKETEAIRQPRDTVRPGIDDAPTFKVEPVKSVVIGAEEIEELVSKTDNDATEKAELLSEERQQEAIPTPKYLHRIDIDGVELVNDSGHFSTLDEAHDWLLTHFMDQVDRGAAGEGYFKTDLTLTFVSRDGELEEFKDRLDIGFGSRSFTPNHQDLFIYLNKSYADYFEERGFILETTAKEVEQKRVQELLQHPIFRDSTNAIDYLLENYVTSQELEMLIVYFKNESKLPVTLTQVQYGLTEVQDTLNIDALVTGFEQNTADWERGLEYVRRYWSHYQNISEEEIYQIHKRFQHPVFRYSSDTISRLRSNSVSSQELDALIARFEHEANLPIPLFTVTTALEEIRELSEEKAPEQAQGQEKNAEGTIGDFPEYQEAAPLPEANQSQPLNDLSPNQTQPQPYLHFTINEEGKSIDKRHYHAISDGELVKLNRYASNLQQAANWYLDTVAGSKIIYFYQEGDVVNSLQVTFDRDKFLHLTGVFPYKEGQTAEQSLLDFAQGKGAFDAILLANKGAAFDKLKVLPELSAITDAQSFYFGDLSDVPKLHSLDMSKAIKSGDEDIVLALRTADQTTFPASLMKLREGLKIQLDHSQQERTILGIYRDRDGVVDQLSIREEIVKDGGQAMLSILTNRQYEEILERRADKELNQEEVYDKRYYVRLEWAERRPNGPHVPFQDGDLIDYQTFVEALYRENQAYYQKHQNSKRMADPVTNGGYLPYTKVKFDIYDSNGTLIEARLRYNIGDEIEPISQYLKGQVELAKLDELVLSQLGDPRKLGLQVPEESQVAWERYDELSDSHEGKFSAVVDAADQLGLVDKNSNFYQEWNQDRIYNEDYHVRLQWAERRPNGPHVPFQDGDLIDYQTFVEALYKENQAYYQKHQDSKRIADPATNEGYLPYTKTKFDVYAPGGMLIAGNITYDLADETEPISRLFGLSCHSLEDQAELAVIDEVILSQLESQELGQEITKETRASSLKETPAQGQGRDTDGDGVSDTVERSLGTDPYDAASTPYHRVKEEEKQVSNFPQKTLVDILNEKDTKALSDHLKQGMREYMNSDQYKNFLTAMGRFHDYSVKNIQLILAQNPAATRVASYQTWKEHFGRQVQKGEKGMKIFIPIQVKVRDENGEVRKDENGQEMTATRFKLGTVFDVKQTEGKELPKPLHLLEGTVPDYETLYRASRQVSLDNHVPISFKEIEIEANGYYNVETKEIVIAEKQMSEAQIMKTLFHEMAHSRLHHHNDGLTSTERELQAESIAYVVASHYGIDTSDYSFAYLHLWSDDQKNYSDLEAQLKIIQTESKQLMKEIDARFSQIKAKSKIIDKFQSKLEKTTAEMKTAIEQKRAEEKFQMAKKLPAPHKEH